MASGSTASRPWVVRCSISTDSRSSVCFAFPAEADTRGGQAKRLRRAVAKSVVDKVSFMMVSFLYMFTSRTGALPLPVLTPSPLLTATKTPERRLENVVNCSRGEPSLPHSSCHPINHPDGDTALDTPHMDHRDGKNIDIVGHTAV